MLVASPTKRPYMVEGDSEAEEPKSKKQLVAQAKEASSKKARFNKQPQLLRGFGNDLAKLIFPYLTNKEAANFTPAHKSLYNHFAISKCRQFLQNPKEEISEIVYSLLPYQDVTKLSQVNKAWKERISQQISCDFNKQKDLPELLYFLSAFDQEQPVDLDTLPDLNSFKQLDAETVNKKLKVAAKNLFRDLAKTPEQQDKVKKLLSSAAEQWHSALEDLTVEKQELAAIYWKEQKPVIINILKECANPSIKNFYETPQQLVNFFTKMEPALRESILFKAVNSGELSLVRFLLNLTAASLIEISPLTRGLALIMAVFARQRALEMVKFIIKSGPIVEGELLDREGFIQNSESKRSSAIFAAVQKGDEAIVKFLLEDHLISATDQHLEDALSEAVTSRQKEVVRLLLMHIPYRAEAIQSAKELAEQDDEELVLIEEILAIFEQFEQGRLQQE